MAKVQRRNLPEALLIHLVTRIRERNISAEQIVLLARWLDTEPNVPEDKWFKRFDGFIVCGEGGLIKTFLLPSQAPDGLEIS